MSKICQNCKSTTCSCHELTTYQIAKGMVLEFIQYTAELFSNELSAVSSTSAEFTNFWKVNKMNKKWKRMLEQCLINGKAAILVDKVDKIIYNIDNIIYLVRNQNDKILSVIYQLYEFTCDSTFKGVVVGSWTWNEATSLYDYQRGYWMNGGWAPYQNGWGTNWETRVPSFGEICPLFIFNFGSECTDIITRYKYHILNLINMIKNKINFVNQRGLKLLINNTVATNDTKYKKLMDALNSEDYFSLVNLSSDEIRDAILPISGNMTSDQLDTITAKEKSNIIELLLLPIFNGATAGVKNLQTTEVNITMLPKIKLLNLIKEQKTEELQDMLTYIGISAEIAIDTTDIDTLNNLAGGN